MSLQELARAAGLDLDDLDLLAEMLREEGVQVEEETGIRRVPAAEAPLSFSQERLWFLDRLTPGTATYNMPGPLRLRGPLDTRVLARCFAEIARRHESLRTRFAIREGTPVQVIDPPGAWTIPGIDLTALPAPRRQAEAERLANEESGWPFQLDRGPLLRTLLLRLDDGEGGGEHVLLLTMHHIISDGWSMGVLFRELTTLYQAFTAGEPSPLPELPVQYADFARWQRERLAGPDLETQLAYWRERLAGSPEVIDLPLDRPRPPVQSFQGEAVQVAVPRPVAESLKALGLAEGASSFMILLAAFKLLLGRWSGQEDVLAGTPIAGRARPEVEGLIGFFLNTLVLRTDLSGRPTFRELVRRVREAALGAYAHQDVPFERLLEDLQSERDLSRTPLFQVFFNMLNLPRSEVRLPSRLTLEPLAGSTVVESKFDLTVYAAEREDGFAFNLVYNADLFDRPRMEELLRQYRRVLDQVAADPDAPIDAVSLVTPAALDLLPDPAAPLGDAWHGAVHELFAARARRHPDRLAVIDGEGTWTYGDLAEAVARLASRLRADGIVSGEPVAIWAHRSAPLVWAVLGVLEAGGAFVVLDPTYPPARLADIVRLAAPRAWLEIAAAGAPPPEVEDLLMDGRESPLPLAPSPVRHPAFRPERERGNAVAAGEGESRLGGGAPLPLGEGGGGRAGEGSGEGATGLRCRLTLPGGGPERARALLSAFPEPRPSAAVGPDDLAYIAFTSGSTGLPKGILGRHGPLSHFLPWQQERFGLADSDRYSLLSGLAHDPLQRDIFTPLCTGATLCVPSVEEIATPGRLAAWMATQGITVAHLTPAMGQLLTETGGGGPSVRIPVRIPTLRWVLLVGDILTRLDVDRIQALAPAVTCVNLYGSTETQRAVGYHVVKPERARTGEHAKQILPLGQGMRDVQLLVAGRVSRVGSTPSPRLAGIGERGEIWVRSPHLARGYLHDEPLTADRFRTNPFTGKPGDRIYRTGDLGRYLPDGEVAFAGRADQQVKIRGFRIELGEIEAVLGRLPGVRESIVLLREDAPGGEKRLVAYIVSEKDGTVDAAQLRDALRTQVPAYMVPAAFVLLERLPLTPNGKVDRRALARIAPERPDGEGVEGFVEPASDLERVIAGIWCEVLGLERVGAQQNFFDLGGHSLLLVRLHARLQEALGRELTLVDLFNYPNVRALAGFLNREAGRGTGGPGDAGLAQSKDRAQKQIEAARRQKELARARRGT